MTTSFDLAYALEIAPTLLAAARITLLATLGGFLIAPFGGLLLALLRRSRLRPVRWAAIGAIEFIRSTPLLIQLFVLFYALPSYGVTLSPMAAGIIGLGVHYSAYLAEVYRAGIDNFDRGQWEACTALGLSRRRTWVRIVLPQIVPTLLPVFGNYLIQMFKDTPLLSTVTVIELLGAALDEASHTFRYIEPITIVGIVFLALSYASSLGVRKLEGRLGVGV